MANKRANGEGSIYPYRNGFAAYVWVNTPDGKCKRKYVYGESRDIVHEKWIKLHAEANKGPVPTSTPTLARFLDDWLASSVRPNLAPLSVSTYETCVRWYIKPFIGSKKLDRLKVSDLRTWLVQLRETCQCCAQGKDARRRTPRCCAVGQCCQQTLSARSVRDARTILRSALSVAVVDDLIQKNPAALVRVPTGVRRVNQAWSVAEAHQLLTSARNDGDSLYAAYVLILALGLRKGEVLGLSWADVDFDKAEVYINLQIQRVKRELLHRETKTQASTAPLPLPALCTAALKLRRDVQEKEKMQVGREWKELGLVFTTDRGTPVDPRGFNRRFDTRIKKAGVRRIKVHDARRTCASLLAVLGVHPAVAQRILRHAQIATTMDIYTEIPSPEVRDALGRLGDQLGEYLNDQLSGAEDDSTPTDREEDQP